MKQLVFILAMLFSVSLMAQLKPLPVPTGYVTTPQLNAAILPKLNVVDTALYNSKALTEAQMLSKLNVADTVGYYALYHDVSSSHPYQGEYHVDPILGNDLNDGSEGKPFLTLSWAVVAANASGGLVILHRGDYSTPVTLNSSIILTSAQGESAPYVSNITISAGSTAIVVLSGLKLETLTVTSAAKVTIKDCQVIAPLNSSDATTTINYTNCDLTDMGAPSVPAGSVTSFTSCTIGEVTGSVATIGAGATLLYRSCTIVGQQLHNGAFTVSYQDCAFTNAYTDLHLSGGVTIIATNCTLGVNGTRAIYTDGNINYYFNNFSYDILSSTYPLGTLMTNKAFTSKGYTRELEAGTITITEPLPAETVATIELLGRNSTTGIVGGIAATQFIPVAELGIGTITLAAAATTITIPITNSGTVPLNATSSHFTLYYAPVGGGGVQYPLVPTINFTVDAISGTDIQITLGSAAAIGDTFTFQYH